MTITDLFDIFSKFAGTLSLLIIAIPKLSEMVLGRAIAISIEKRKAEFQSELERLKGSLALELERHKVELQRNLSREQREHSEKLAIRGARVTSAMEFHIKLSHQILEAAAGVKESPQSAYAACAKLLDLAYSAESEQLLPLQEYLKELDQTAEAPGALVETGFQAKIDEILHRLAVASEKAITSAREIST